MQVPEMRTFYTQKQIITLGFIHKSLSHPRFISVQSLRNPQFLRFNQYRHGHNDPSSTEAERKLSSGTGNGTPNANARRVFTAYDSLTGRVVSQRQRGPISALNPEAGSDSGGDGGRTYLDEGERTYRNVRKAESAPRLHFDRRVAGERAFQKESLVDGRVAGERAFQKGSSVDGRVTGERAFQKGSSVDGRFGLDYPVKKWKSPSLWVCSKCGHRESEKWERCRVCKNTGTMDQVSSNDGVGNGKKTSGFGVSGNKLNSYGRERTYGSTEKASVVGGYGSDFHKTVGSFSKETEELVGNKKSVNDMRELQVSENLVFPSAQKQAGEVHPQPMMVEKVTRWTSRGVSDDDFIDGRVSENVNTGEDISGERAVTFAENDSSTHGLGKELTSEAVQGNKTSGLEVSENAVYSSHPKQVSDALPSPLMVKQELDLTSRNEVQMSLPTSGNEINGLDGSGTEGSVKRSKWVHGSVSRSGVDAGVKDSSKENLVFPSAQKQAGEVHPQPMMVEKVTRWTSRGVSDDDFIDGRVSENVNTGEDISGERAVTFAENDSSTHGLGKELTSEAVQGNKTSGLEVSENAVYSSHPKQVSDALPSPLMVKQELDLTSRNEVQMSLPTSGNEINGLDGSGTEGSVKRSKWVHGSVSRSGVDAGVKDSSKENLVFPSAQKQAGEVHPQPMMVEKVTRWTSRGVSDDDFIDGRVSENVNTGEDISGERAVTFAENDSSTHGLGKELTSEAVQGNKTSGLEVSENAVYSSHPKQVSDALPSPLMVKQELDLTSRNEVQMSLPTSGNEINGLDGSGTEGSVKRSKWVHGSVSSSGVDAGVKDSSKENLVFPSAQKQAGEVHPQPMMVEKVTRWTSRGVSDDDFIDGRVSENVNTGEDISGERVVTFAENDSTHGLGKELTSEAVQGNKTSGLEVSENAVYSSHPKQVSDALPSPLMVKQELDLTSRNEVQMSLPTSGNEINGLDGSGTEGSVKRSKWVHGSVSSSGVDEGVKDSSKERAFRVVEKGSSTCGFGQEFNVGDVVTKKKKGKSIWVCSSCGHNEGQWWGLCKSCKSVGTMKRLSIGDYGGSVDNTGGFDGSENAERSWLPKRADQVLPLRLTDVNRGINKLEWRIPLFGSFGSEVARVLGGGLVPGSLVLVGGDPGVGKSTLLLQLAAIIAEGHDVRQPGPVVYVSGEESVEQIGNRADRMDIGAEELFLYSGTDIEDILGKAHLLSPRLLIVDSIQTVYLKDVTGSAGGLSQVKECTSALLRYSKKTNVPVLLIGHVTKTGDIAGPRVLEHIVDVVLYLEGEKYTSHRLLRSIKNRFGSTDELGVFEMSQSGLLPVANPSEMYLTEQQADSEFLVGLAVAVIMDGTRSFLIEIQALCVSGSRGSRHFNGVHDSRADMIISVLTKQAGLKLQEGAIFLNVVSGVTLAETAGDLAIAAAICSSFLELPIPTGFAFIGEIGLSGELRGVPRMDIRVNTVAQLGYKKCIVPKSALKSLKGLYSKEMEVIGCTNLKQVISMVFTTPIN